MKWVNLLSGCRNYVIDYFLVPWAINFMMWNPLSSFYKEALYSEQPTKCRTKIGLGGYEHCLYVWVLHPRIMSQILTVKYGAGWLMLGVFCGCWFRSSCKDSDMCQDILVQNLVTSASRLRFVCTSILYPSSK